MIGILSTDLRQIDCEHLQEIGEVGVFTDCYIPPKNLDKLPVFSISQSFNFAGILVSTNLQTTIMLKKNSATNQKVFYVSELEWLSMDSFTYRELFTCFHDPSIPLITTPELHDIVGGLFKQPAGSMERLDKQLIYRIHPND